MSTMEKTSSDIVGTNLSSSTQRPQTYTIGGVKVEFPTRAYPSQIAMMDKVIRGINTTQNCLLESPTGTGKTLALLCSALAWQRAEMERLAAIKVVDLENDDVKDSKTLPPFLKGSTDVNECFQPSYNSSSKEDKDMEDFVSLPCKKRLCLQKDQEQYVLKSNTVKCLDEKSPFKLESQKGDVNATESVDTRGSLLANSIDDNAQTDQPFKQIRAPQIYYGTRTHKQIEQVIRELKRTAYKNTRMTILSSRELTCIQSTNGLRKTKTELCKELVDPVYGNQCYFYSRVHRIGSHRELNNNQFSSPWSIEEFVSLGKYHKACPYFAARSLSVTAEIIFCPYNYLIDPLIRQSMKINLNGDIVIFDEAHNIEDVCRDSASISFLEKDLTNAIGEINSIADYTLEPQAHKSLASFLKTFSESIEALKQKIKFSEFDEGSFSMNGHEAAAFFKIHGFGLEDLSNFEECLQAVNASNANNEDRGKAQRVISSSSHGILEGLYLVLSFLYSNFEDYRVVLVRSMSRNLSESFTPGKSCVSWAYTLNFWCQNPSIIFEEVRQNTRSIILSSGTLSPMDTFQSELNTQFPIQLEANHVIDKSNVWVGTVPRGPRGIILNAQYKNTESYEFQDELGLLILQICKIIPHGILCFFPSYRLLEKLVQRWMDTDLWTQLLAIKNVIQEPRRSDQLNRTMQEFYDSIEQSEISDIKHEISDIKQTGALFLAVIRGKVSEGLDFADNNARAVIAVGIPYPNYFDTQVKLKREYNNAMSSKKGLLTGKSWYDIQAYRSLNQALGRCIRHKEDWGAIFLVDSRFSQGTNYTKGLSKWVRNRVHHYNNWNAVQQTLQEFLNLHIVNT